MTETILTKVYLQSLSVLNMLTINSNHYLITINIRELIFQILKVIQIMIYQIRIFNKLPRICLNLFRIHQIARNNKLSLKRKTKKIILTFLLGILKSLILLETKTKMMTMFSKLKKSRR